MTDDEIEKGERLHRIFMPTADHRIATLVSDRGRLAHYTTAEAAIQILRTRKLWLRNARNMHDFSEVVYGFNEIQKYFGTDSTRVKFQAALDGLPTAIYEKSIYLLGQWWEHIHSNTYLGCFSEHLDEEDQFGRLSMWRYFGRAVPAVALVINCPQRYSALPLNVMLMPVSYYSDGNAFSDEMERVRANIVSNREFLSGLKEEEVSQWLYAMLHLTAVTTKHPGFHEEREWRLCHFPTQNESKHVPPETVTIAGVPQIVHTVSFQNKPDEGISGIAIPELLDRVIIGPSQYSLTTRQALIRELQHLGIENAGKKVVVSDIPIRG